MKTQRVQWTLIVLAILVCQLSWWATSFAQGRPGIVWMAVGHAASVTSVAFSPDGRYLASGSEDRTIKLWRVSDGALVRTLYGHTDWVSSVAFSPDGQYLASGSGDKTVRLWCFSDGTF